MEETLGKRIMAHRKRLGLTQDQLAEKLGVTPQAVSKWENDQSCPDITTLPRLAELFGTTTDALLGREPVYETQVVDRRKDDDDDHDDDDDDDSGWDFQWNGGRRGGLTLGIFVVLVGMLLLASELLHWGAGFWSIAWPSALLVFGIASMVRRLRVTNAVCTVLGGYFLVQNLGFLPFTVDKKLLLPALVVIIGVCLLVDALRRPRKPTFHIHNKGKNTKSAFQEEGERFHASLAFGEATRRVTLPRLSGGKATVSFGELVVDLTGCGQIVDGCRIDATVSFGEMTLQVPRCYQVRADCGTSFGNIEYHGHCDDEVKGTISLAGGASFGSLVVRYL